MNNYEWQRQYTRQRIDSRLREAEAHRRAAEGRAKPVGAARWARRYSVAAAWRALIGLILSRLPTTEHRLFHSKKRS